MKASELLLETLEKLAKDDFEKFKWYLANLDGCKPIPKSCQKDLSCIDTVTKMLERCGEESAVSVSIETLKKMNMNNAAEMLEEKYTAAGGKTAATSPSPSPSSSASAPPAAPASISAVDGGVVVAPNITGSTTGSLNITIHKP